MTYRLACGHAGIASARLTGLNVVIQGERLHDLQACMWSYRDSFYMTYILACGHAGVVSARHTGLHVVMQG